ncbi:hypothetical protein D3C86_1670830 [compost metagenome]
MVKAGGLERRERSFDHMIAMADIHFFEHLENADALHRLPQRNAQEFSADFV